MARYDETVRRGAEEVARRVGERNYRVATPDEVLEQAEEWSPQQITCRIRRHRFAVPIDAIEVTRYKYIWVRLGCVGECGVELHQEVSTKTGKVLWSKPYYGNAPGYLSKNGRVLGEAQDALRLVQIRQSVRPSKTQKDIPGHFGDDDA